MSDLLKLRNALVDDVNRNLSKAACLNRRNSIDKDDLIPYTKAMAIAETLTIIINAIDTISKGETK